MTARDFDLYIERLRQLPNVPAEVAPRVAKVVRDTLLGNVSRGTDANGKPWKPTQAGHTPLQNTSSELVTGSTGTLVVARVDGVHARHHSGAVKGRIARPILPTTNDIPTPMVAAIDRVVMGEFRKTMEGA